MKCSLHMTSNEINSECADDFDWESITDPIHLKFLKWTHYIESEITHLKLNLKYYDKFIIDWILDEKIKRNCEVFQSITITNLVIVIVVGFEKLLNNINKLCISRYLNFCSENQSLIFKDFDSSMFKISKSKLKVLTGSECYASINKLRDKIFAHGDEIIIDNEQSIEYLMEKVSSEDLNNIIKDMEKIMNSIWNMYRNKDLWYTIDGENDIDTVLEKLSNNFYCNENND